MKSNFTLKELIIIIIGVIGSLLLVIYFYISHLEEKNQIKTIIKNSQEDVKRLHIVREYYTKHVVADVKKYAKNLEFSTNHIDREGILPFPTTVIHDLTEMYSSRSDIKIEMYSDFPFKNRINRVLTPFQKKAIAAVEKNEEGIFYEKDFINGQKVLRVAVADYMILPACVNCHNTHPLKNWPDDKWKLGDKRGVLEIITPLK